MRIDRDAFAEAVIYIREKILKVSSGTQPGTPAENLTMVRHSRYRDSKGFFRHVLAFLEFLSVSIETPGIEKVFATLLRLSHPQGEQLTATDVSIAIISNNTLGFLRFPEYLEHDNAVSKFERTFLFLIGLFSVKTMLVQILID